MLNNFLLFLAGLSALVMAALFAVPMAVDWNQYRSVFEQHATRLLGREVRVGDGVNLRLLPSPYVRFENVRIADRTGRFDKPLARIEAFTLWLSVAPLLRGEIEAKAVELTGPELRLSIDQNGQGNWFGLGLNGAGLPFMPRDVSLKAVAITDGRLRLTSANGVELMSYDKIDGELSSPAVQGPYRFQGTLEEAGTANELRISTLKFVEQGPLGFKAAIRVPSRGRSYEFDGALHDMMSQPRIDGALSGRIALASNTLVGTDATLAGAAREGQADGIATNSARIVELRSKVEADPNRLRLSEMALTFDSVGKPQALGGEVLVGWQQGTVVAGELKARWLDLDTILGVDRSAKLRPWRAVAGLIRDIGLTIPSATKAQLSFEVDQATLGADAVGPLRLELVRADGKTRIEAFEAGVPGGGHVTIAGNLIENRGLPGFKGPVRARGASLSRFLSWLEPDLVNIEAGDGAFLLSANLEADDRRLSFSRAFGEIAGSGFKGAMEYRARAADGSGRAKLILDLDSDNLDISALARMEHVTAPIRALFKGNGTGSPEPAPASNAAGPIGKARPGGFASTIFDIDSYIDLRIGRLLLADGRLRDVSVNMRLAEGNLDIPQIRFESDDGMSLDLSGKATGIGTSARGKLQFAVAARDAASIELVAGAFGAREDIFADGGRLADFAPLRLAGTVELGAQEGGAMQVSLDGIAGASRAVMMARVEGAGALLDRDIDLRATLSAADGLGLLVQLAPHMRAKLANETPSPDAGSNAAVLRGVASLRAVGVPSGGMSSALTIEAADISATFSGDTRWIDGVPTVTGEARVRSPRGQRALALGGLDRFFDAHGDELEFATQIERRDGGYDLRAAQLVIGERVMTGSGRVEVSQGRTGFDLGLASTQLRLGELLAFSVRPPAKAAAAANAGSGEERQADIWSKHAFDFSPLQGLEGQIRLAVDTLEIADGLSLSDVKLTAGIAPSGLKIALDHASMLNGSVSGSGQIVRRSAGARLEAAFDLVDVNLGDISERGDRPGRLTGKVNAHVKLAGQGLSPRGLAAVMTGQGQLGLRQAGIGDLDPQVIDKVAESVLAGPDTFDAETLRNLLLQEVPGAEYMIGDQTIALEIVDGTVKLAPIEAGALSSQLRVTTSLDIADLVVQSEWRLSEIDPAQAAREETTPLVVTMLYSGDLVDVTRLEPVIDVDTLERELAFRKIVRERIDQPQLQLDSGGQRNGSLTNGNAPVGDLPVLAVPREALASEALLVPGTEEAPAAGGLGAVQRLPLPTIAPPSRATGSRATGSRATGSQPANTGTGNAATGNSGSDATGAAARTQTRAKQEALKRTRDDDIWRSIVIPR